MTTFMEMTLRNFLSYGDATQTMLLHGRGLTRINGENVTDTTVEDNGSGKTALLDALLWCLFGVTTRKRGGHMYRGDDVINRHGAKKDCVVTVLFKQNKTTYRAVRARKSKEYGTGFRLFVDGRDITEKNVSDVSSLLRVNAQTFATACLFGKSEAYKYTSLKPTERQAAFDEILQLNRFAEAYERTRKELRVVEDKLEDAESRKSAALSALEAISKTPTHKMLADLKRQASRLPKVDDAELRVVQDNENRARKVLRDANNTLHELRWQLKVERGRQERLVGGVCPTCGAKSENNAKAARKAQSNADKLEKDITARVKRVEKLTLTYTKVSERLSALLTLARQSNDLASQIRRLQKTLDSSQTVREHKATLEKHKKQIKRLKVRKAELVFWSEAYGPKGIRLAQATESLEDLNEHAEKLSHALTGGNIVVKFKADRQLKTSETVSCLHIDVVHAKGADSLAGVSEGESSKVDLIVGMSLQLFAAQQSKVKTNFVWFDEPFEAMDAKACEGLTRYLHAYARNFDSVFVITHNSSLQSVIASATTVRKTADGSVLV